MTDLWLWILISALSGIAEASIFHQVSWSPDRTFKKPFDEHFYLGLLRIAICFTIFRQYPYFGVPMFCAGMMFPMIHDGLYYTMRNFWDRTQYKMGFFDSSTDTDAWLSLTFPMRAFLFVLGLFMFIAYKTLFP